MERPALRTVVTDMVVIVLGAALYALGFDLFLRPNDITGGGISGLGLIFAEVTGFRSVGLFVIVCNIPLFCLGWTRIGRRFILGSLLGVLVSSILLDVFALLPGVETEPLLAGLYGGVLIGVGLGLVFLRGASTGGVDIIARLVKRRLRQAPIGKIMFAFDGVVVLLTGLVFHDINKALYSAVALYVSTAALDMVIYGRSDAGVALIISERYEEIAAAIDRQLGRGATLIDGAGAYTGAKKTVVLCAVKSQQVGRLQAMVSSIDPDAFLILQKAHQILGEGFGRYSDNSL